MAEQRIRFVGEFVSEGADRMKRELAEVKAGARDIQSLIGQGSNQSADLAGASQPDLTGLEASTKALHDVFAKLPDEVQKSLSGVLENLRRADFAGALSTGKVNGMPSELNRAISDVATQARDATTLAPGASVSGTIRRVLPSPEPAEVAQQRGTRASLEPVGSATPYLRAAVEAVKGGDLEVARTQQRTGARTALQTGDHEGLETATGITRLFRTYDARENGTESAKRYAETLEGLEQRIAAAEAANSPSSPSLAPKTALGRASRMLGTVDATLAGGISKPGEIAQLERNLGRANAYLGQAEKGGAEGRELRDLKEQLERLTEALGKNREALDQNGSGQSPEPQQPDSPKDGGVGGDLLDELKRFAGSGMGGGLAGRVLSRLGPAGMAVGAGVAVNHLAERMVAGPNRQAREVYGAEVDLARLYGYNSADGLDPIKLFRAQGSGLSQDELIERGFTATDAARTMAQLDTPYKGRADEPREDVLDVLQLARSNGLEEGQLADLTKRLHEAGVYTVGDANVPLETLKMALSDSVRSGVNQADTLQSLVNLTAQGLSEGRMTTQAGFAMQASLRTQLAATDVTLKGDAGMAAQERLNGMVTGANDPGIRMMMVPAVQGMTAEELGLKGYAAKGYTELQKTSPMGAGFNALEIIQSGNKPEQLAMLARRLEEIHGMNPDFLNSMLEWNGVGVNQRLAIAGRGLAETYDAAADNTPRYQQGEDLTADVQGGNELDRRSRRVLAQDRDRTETKGWGSLSAVGDVGEIASGVKRSGERATRNFLSRGGLYDDVNQGVIDERGNLATPGNGPASAAPLVEPETEPRTGRPPPPREVAPPVISSAAPPEQVVPRVNPGRPPSEKPQEPAVQDLGAALQLMNATAVTTQPGERYGESLRGTPAEWLIGQQHRGVDLRIGAAGKPDPITSPWANAKVIGADHSETLGNWMALETPTGDRYSLGHLDDDRGEKMIGKTLKRGEVIGMEGTTGSSTGHHLDLRLFDETEEQRRTNLDPSAFYKRFLESVNARIPSGPGEATSRNGEVHVYHHGLERVSIEGLEPVAKAKAETSLREFTSVIRAPTSHRGPG